MELFIYFIFLTRMFFSGSLYTAVLRREPGGNILISLRRKPNLNQHFSAGKLLMDSQISIQTLNIRIWKIVCYDQGLMKIITAFRRIKTFALGNFLFAIFERIFNFSKTIWFEIEYGIHVILKTLNWFFFPVSILYLF